MRHFHRLLMWRILPLVSSLSTITNGQQNQKDRPPEIVKFLSHDLIKPEQVKFKEKNALVLPCGATGNNLKWSWKHNDKTIPDYVYELKHGKRRLTNNGTLIGSYLDSSHSGTYQCFVEDTASKIQTFSRKIKVNVTVVGKFTDKTSKHVTVKLGDTLIFDCPAHQPSYGVSYSWEGNDYSSQFKRNERRAISQNGKLFIMNVTEADVDEINGEGGIKCKMSAANRFATSGRLALKLEVSGKDPAQDNSPTWAITPAGVEEAVEGRKKELYCLALGRSTPTISWRKNGTKIAIAKEEAAFDIPWGFQNRLLNITKVRKDQHEDMYSCEAEVNETSVLKYSFTLKVEVSPRWMSLGPPKSKIAIDMNGNGTITCDVTAEPPPIFSWHRDGQPISQPTLNDSTVRVENNKLHFTKVSLNGDGVYQCVAENLHGMIVSSTWVHILTRSPFFEKKDFGPFYLFYNTEGRLKCDPDAVPRPFVFKWYKEGKELNTAPYGVQADGTLVIDTVDRKRDAGEYECFAKNIVGNATAKGNVTVFENTRIIVKPEDLVVNEGTRIDLRCEAEADPSLELRYVWKRNNADVIYNENIEWQESLNVLTIADMTVEDSGIYTCVAYTPEPQKSEDKASARIDVTGVPYPPKNLQLSSDCLNRKTTLTWNSDPSNNTNITHLLIEQKSDFPDDVWEVTANVTDLNAMSFSLNLTGWATLYFRMRTVNCFGPSRPSLPTSTICRTQQGAPDKWPDNLRGVANKAEMLDITWTPMPNIDWNAPGLYYKLWYGRVGDILTEVPKFCDPERNVFNVPDAGYYALYQFQIQAGNDEGLGPKSPLVRSYSGQNAPDGKPEHFTVETMTERSVSLSWTPVSAFNRSVDGYRIYYWVESRLHARRHKRTIPSYASFDTVTDGNTQKHTVIELKPYTIYNIAMRAFNSGGEGPTSVVVLAQTDEAEPEPPTKLNDHPFDKYILVTWQPPLEPNGIITGYRVGSKAFPGFEPEDVVVEMQEGSALVHTKLLKKQEPETNYVVEVQAQTRKGWGTSARKTTRTVKWAAPARPNRPTVEGTDVDKVRITCNFGLGGGYTHEFLVMYRKKLAGEIFQNTSWVNHFDSQSIEIGNLSPDLYQFKTVGRSDYPNQENPQESPASDVTDGRPLPGVLGKRTMKPVHDSPWFIALLLIIALITAILAGLLIWVIYQRHRGAKYRVGKRERTRGAVFKREPYDAASIAGRTEDHLPLQSNGSLQLRGQDSDPDSLDEYEEGPQFNEDGSFIGEYGDEKE